MNIKRMRRLRKVLSKIPNDSSNFDMACWWCESAGCAAGHATQDPVLQAEGLKLESFEGMPVQYPSYKEHISYDALREFFDITYQQTEWLFNKESYIYEKFSTGITYNPKRIGPNQVIQRIDRLLDRYRDS